MQQLNTGIVVMKEEAMNMKAIQSRGRVQSEDISLNDSRRESAQVSVDDIPDAKPASISMVQQSNPTSFLKRAHSNDFVVSNDSGISMRSVLVENQLQSVVIGVSIFFFFCIA
jgi:hypothetical protein